MNLPDLIHTRDAAAERFDAAQADYHLHGGGERYRTVEAARKDRRTAQDAVDAATSAFVEPDLHNYPTPVTLHTRVYNIGDKGTP